MKMMIAFIAACLAVAAQDSDLIAGRNSNFLIKMTNSVNTLTGKKGDKVTGVVIASVSLRGGRVEGEVVFSYRGQLHFVFTTLRFNGKTIPMQSEVTGIVNSKGTAGQDDLGQRIRVQGGTIIAYGTSTSVDEGAEISFVDWKP